MYKFVTYFWIWFARILLWMLESLYINVFGLYNLLTSDVKKTVSYMQKNDLILFGHTLFYISTKT